MSRPIGSGRRYPGLRPVVTTNTGQPVVFQENPPSPPPDTKKFHETRARMKRALRTPEQRQKVEEEEWAAYMEKLYSESLTPGCPAAKMELYAKLKGKLVDKPVEVRIGLSADEIARRELEADRRIKELRSGMESVPEKLPVLP